MPINGYILSESILSINATNEKTYCFRKYMKTVIDHRLCGTVYTNSNQKQQSESCLQVRTSVIATSAEILHNVWYHLI